MELHRIACLLIWVLFAVVAHSQVAEAISQDGKALLAFLHTVNSTQQQQLPVLSSWNPSDSDPCGWLGVSCNPITNRVTGLSLTSVHLQGRIPPEFGYLTQLQLLNLTLTNLTGTIPPELGSCTELEVVDLGNNNLGGSIPDSVSKLRRMRVLMLQANELWGEIPASLGSCSRLEVLSLFDNQLNGSIPSEIGQLQSLQVLRAGGNPGISGSIPAGLGNCTNLTTLGLAMTSISGEIPATLGRLKKLEILAIYGAGLSGGIPPELGGCSSLQLLYLYQNRLSGRIPEELGKLSGLINLFLWQNELSGSIPAAIGGCRSLVVVDVASNSLSGGIPREIGLLSSLQGFYVSGNNLTGSIPAELGNCTELVNLEFDTNQLSGPLPASLGHLNRLQVLFFWDNKLSGPIPSSLRNCSQLQTLDLSMNRLSGSIPEELFTLPSLQRLLLLGNRLSGELSIKAGSSFNASALARLRVNDNLLVGRIPPGLGEMRNLTFLDLQGNHFSGAIPAEIGNLNSLQMLNLHANELSGRLPASLGRLRELQALDASSNALEGEIPPEMGSMQALEHLDLHENELSGRVPDDIGSCKELLSLDLSDNQLEGEIPSALGSLGSLSITLDLHGNAFTGTIPDSFAELTHLGRLDLSHNRLVGSLRVLGQLTNLNSLNVSFNAFTGSLPDTEVFRAMGRESFDGNPGLCLQPTSDSGSCARGGGRGADSKGPMRPSVVVGLLFGGTALVVIVGSILLYRRCRSFSGDLGEWKMTRYHKWNSNISVYDVVQSLERATLIGHGGSGLVYQVKMPDGEVIAIKKIDIGSAATKRSSQGGRSFDSEIHTLGSNIRHKNIVRLIGYCSNREVGLLMYDFKINGSLGELLHEKKRSIDWECRYKIALGAAQGIAYLHHDCNPPILHRDVKANNILLGAGMEPFIADFGLAKLLLDEDSFVTGEIPGTTGYIAPEYSCRVKITTKSDVYSYGVVLLEILTGRRALEHDKTVVDWVHSFIKEHQHPKIEALDSRMQGMPDPFIQEMLQVFGIALMCVNPSPSERPTMKDVVAFLEHIKHAPEEVVHKNTQLHNTLSSDQRYLLHDNEESSERRKRLVINQKLCLQKQSSYSELSLETKY